MCQVWENNTSTYVGILGVKMLKWISQITIEGKTKYLGLFDNEEDVTKIFRNIERFIIWKIQKKNWVQLVEAVKKL